MKLVNVLVSVGCVYVLLIIFCVMCLSFLKFRFFLFLICKWKLLIVFNFIIGGGGNIVIKVFFIDLKFWLSCVVMVLLDRLGVVFLLKLVSVVNNMFEFGLLVNLLIFKLGNVIVFLILGCFIVI